jgi:hypothetical protein
MTEKASTLADSASSMKESFQQFIKNSGETSGPSAPLMDETFSFDASDATNFLLLIFYYMAKCHEFKKPMDLMKIADLTMKLEEEPLSSHQKVSISFLGIGIIGCIQCFLETDSITRLEGKKGVRIEKLPSGFQEHISRIIDVRIQDSATKSSEKGNLVAGMKKIDAYVEAA